MAKNHGASVKNDEIYEKLRDKGQSKQKAARIANAQENTTQNPSKNGGKASKYEGRTKADLMDVARKVNIQGRSTMNKDELIHALRSR